MKKGEVWLVDLSGRIGSEQTGYRPCLIVQDNKGASNSPTVVVCPITSRDKTFHLTHVPVDLLKPSTILCEQIVTVDKSRMGKYLVAVDAEVLAQVREKIMIVLGM